MTTSWTFMVYLAGFNNLSDFAVKDLAEMRAVGSTDEVCIATFAKHQAATGARRTIIRLGGDGEEPEELGDVDSGSPQTMLDFVRWAAAAAPAEKYALVVWNHGSGWRPDDLDALYENVRSRTGGTGVTPREIGMRSSQEISRSLFSDTVEKIFELPTATERGIASDDGTGHSMDTIELTRVLAAAAHDLGGPLELLGMDACLMSNHEVAYEAAQHVRHVVASEDLEPGDGWPYTQILRRLTDDPKMDGAGLGTVIVEEYLRSYEGTSDTVTQCAVDIARMDCFTDAFAGLTAALRASVGSREGRGTIMAAHAAAVSFDGDLVDVRSFCSALRDGDANEDLREAARVVDAALDPVGYVVAEGHRGPEVDGVGGVTVYFPSPFGHVAEHYADVRFARDTAWDEFLSEYHHAIRNR